MLNGRRTATNTSEVDCADAVMATGKHNTHTRQKQHGQRPQQCNNMHTSAPGDRRTMGDCKNKSHANLKELGNEKGEIELHPEHPETSQSPPNPRVPGQHNTVTRRHAITQQTSSRDGTRWADREGNAATKHSETHNQTRAHKAVTGRHQQQPVRGHEVRADGGDKQRDTARTGNHELKWGRRRTPDSLKHIHCTSLRTANTSPTHNTQQPSTLGTQPAARLTTIRKREKRTKNIEPRKDDPKIQRARCDKGPLDSPTECSRPHKKSRQNKA